MTTRYFAGNTLAAFAPSNSTIAVDTTSGHFDSTYVASGIQTPGALQDYAGSPTFSATGTLWIVYEHYTGTSWNGNAFGPLWMNGLTPGYKVAADAGGNHRLYYWNGSSYQNATGTWSQSASTKYRLAVKIVLGTSAEVYLNGVKVADSTGITFTSAQTTITNFRLIATGNGNHTYSQILAADYDIRDARFGQPALNGNSATNTGAAGGTYTDLNDANDATAVIVSTSGNKAGQTKASFSVPTGFGIVASVISVRGRKGGSITDGKIGIRSGSTNYSGSGLSFAGAYEPRQRFDTVDPNTGAAWTGANFNSAEVFLEAA